MAEDTGAEISTLGKEITDRHEHMRLVLQASQRALELGEKDRAERLLSQELRVYDRGFLAALLREEPEEAARALQELRLSDNVHTVILDFPRQFKALVPILQRLAATDQGYRVATRIVSSAAFDLMRGDPAVTVKEYFYDTELCTRTDRAQGILSDAGDFVSHVASSYERCQEAGVRLDEAGLEAAKTRLIELVEGIRRICAATGISEQDIFQLEAEAKKE